MTPVIEGGTAAHRRLLEEIFVGLGSTEIRRVRLGSYVERAVPGGVPTSEDARLASGVSLELVEPAVAGLRVDWEMRLVGVALRERAMREGLEQVVMLALSFSRGTLQCSRSPDAPMSPSEIARVGNEVASAGAAVGALLERFDLSCPLGHAWAARLRVEDPHAFLRLCFNDFMLAVKPWQELCGRQIYIEVVDQHDEPALISATDANHGATRVRPDLTCCDPVVHIGQPMFAPAPPRCPVFG